MKKKHGWVKRHAVSALCLAALFSGVGEAGAATDPKTPEKTKRAPKEEAAWLAKERAKLIVPLRSGADDAFESEPNAKGDYVYEASSARPLVTGATFDIQTNLPAAGLTMARIGGCRPVHCEQPDVQGLYWKLRGVRPGRYWVAVQRQGCNPAVFLNGRVVQATRGTRGVQAAPGFWVAETCVDEPLDLKEGDEIAAQCRDTRDPRIGALLLRPRPPEGADTPLETHLGGGSAWLYTAHGLGAEASFRGADGRELPLRSNYWSSEQETAGPDRIEKAADGRAIVRVLLANPLPVPVVADYRCEVRSYYRRVVGSAVERVTLQPHEAVARQVPFDIVPDEPAYSANVRIEAVKPPRLDWPEGDRIAYFPGLRHTVAWPNPWKHGVLRRIEFNQPIASVRQTMSLDGPWEQAYTTSLEAVYPIPAGLEIGKFTLPGGFHSWPLRPNDRMRSMYLRRTFVLPEECADRSYHVAITFVRDEGTVWVNGQKIGNLRGGNTPLVADATRAVRPGTNEVVVLVRDLTVLMNPAYVNPTNPMPNNLYQDAPGYVSAHRGPGIGSVTLLSAPRVFAEELQALPSFRKHTLTARFGLLSHRETPVQVRMKAHVLDGDRSVLTLDEREVTLMPGVRETVAIEKPWKDPRLWVPSDPHLYVLAVELTEAAGGRRLDLARARFGFRECWVEGPKIVLNGIPIRPKGCLEPRDPEETVMMGRGTGGRPDYYDERGYMGFHHCTGFHNSASRHNLESDKYWETGKANAVTHLRQWINHPSIIGWDLSNEWLCFMDAYAPDPLLPGKRFKGVSDHVRAYDPTRWTIGNAEGDFMGLLDNHCYHYMTPAQGAEAVLGYVPCLPDEQFWRPLDRHFRPGEGVPLSPMKKGTILRTDGKPMINSEHLWKVGWTMPPGLTEVCGEDDVLGWAVDSGSGAASWFWKMQVDGNRDLGVSPIHHYRHPGIHSRACLPRTFLMPDTAHHGFAGRPFVRLFKLFNEDLRPCRMQFKFELVDAGGRVVADDNQTIGMPSGAIHEGRAEITLPKVKARTRYVLKTRLYGDGVFLVGEELDVDVWPDAPIRPGTLARAVHVYDPKGDTVRALEAAGVACARLAQLAPPAGVDPERAVVAIGELALDADQAAEALKLMDFTAAGGRVVVLRQMVTPAGLPAATRLDPSRWASLCFNRLPIHPVMEGLTDWDLAFWADDRATAKGLYLKPERGAAVSLIDSGAAPLGMEYAALMEQYRGRGSYLLCQLPLIEKQDREPMARELLARLLRYAAGGPAFAQPTRTLRVAADGAADVLKSLDAVGVRHEPTGVDAEIAPDRPLLAAAAAFRAAEPARRSALAAALRAGATVVVSGATPDDAAWLTEAAGVPVTLTVQPHANWHGRARRMGYASFTAGLSHQDLYWKRFDGAEQAGGQADNPELAYEALQDFAAVAPGARELVWPGALLELPVGQGRLLLDQRRWMTDRSELAKLAGRNLSALMVGLGVELAPVVPIRPLPKALDYDPIDLTPYANRSLRDETSDDGEGGWSDQGAAADLRAFKTGRVNFQGIPFQVGDHPRSCIVLRNPNRAYPQKFPTEAVIPVGRPVEGFYFLHGCAYTGDGNNIVAYQVQYEDGTVYDIHILGGVNARDWARGPGSGFAREKDTFSSLAWTGSSGMWPVVSVYKMLWVNPRPETPVKAVRYHKEEGWGSVHIFMGVTRVLKREPRELSAAERARVAERLGQAAEAAKRNDLKAAERLYREALAADPEHEEAYALLADVLERKGDADEILDHAHAWVRHGARSPRPYNRIAEILEQRADPRGALDFYGRSLQVEWNQPPVIEARKRLEEALAR